MVRAIVFTAVVYAFWNMAAGTYGFFLPYFLSTMGLESQAVDVSLQSLWFFTTLVFVVLIFMPLGDGRYRRLIFGTVCQIIAFLLLVFFPLDGSAGFNVLAAVANIILFGIGAALVGEPHYKVWSQELFPTMLRTTAQGLTFAVARTCLGIWSFFGPVIAEAGFEWVALILIVFLSISGIVGLLLMSNTAGKSLKEIEAERIGDAHAPATAASS